MGGGLLCYQGASHADPTDSRIMKHKFTVVKPLRSVTRDIKPWDKYRVRGWEIDRHKNCIYFMREVFTLMEYEPTLTVLYGN